MTNRWHFAVATLASACGCSLGVPPLEPEDFPCRDDADCVVDLGYYCREGDDGDRVCMLLPDAGPRDGGGPVRVVPPEAGTLVPDAGRDAGTPRDAGTDGGPDAGAYDAGPDPVPWTDRDDDADGVLNALDAMRALDRDGDGVTETLCVLTHLAMPAPWSGTDAVRQGTPQGAWGGFDALQPGMFAPRTPVPEDPSFHEWCYAFTAEPDGNYQFRFVSVLSTEGSSVVDDGECEDWVRSDFSAFCSDTGDALCRTFFSNDGCENIGSVIGLHWDPAEGIGPI